MSCENLDGRWNRGRLIFGGVSTAVEDDHILVLDEVVGGVVTGKFFHPTTGAELPDTLTHGTCTPVGQKALLTFTRNHATGGVTTVYTGTVILLMGGGTIRAVLVRDGTFTRTSPDDNLVLNVAQGDWETEKPT